MAIPFITLHAVNDRDLTTNGIGVVDPIECEITERAGNYFELRAVFPFGGNRVNQINTGMIIVSPAPVRESPEINVPTGSASTVTRYIYRNNTAANLSIYSKPGAGVRVAVLYSDASCQKIQDKTVSGVSFSQVALTDGGAVGWIPSANLTNTGTTVTVQIGTDTPSGSITLNLARNQPFRIYRVERDAESRTITVYAQHLTYDWGNVVFRHNMPNTSSPTFTSFYNTYMVGNTYLTGDLDALGFEIVDYTNAPFKLNDDHLTAKLKTPLEVLLGDGGILEQVNGCLVRDGQKLYIVPKSARASSYVIEYGKNLLSANLDADITDCITGIYPVGKNADNTPLYYGGIVWASNANAYGYTGRSRYVTYDVNAASASTADVNAAKQQLREKATADLANAAGSKFYPKYELSTSFVDLSLAKDYKNLANYYKFHLYDMVTVKDKGAGINSTMRLDEYRYNVLSGEYTSVTLSDEEDA